MPFNTSTATYQLATPVKEEEVGESLSELLNSGSADQPRAQPHPEEDEQVSTSSSSHLDHPSHERSSKFPDSYFAQAFRLRYPRTNSCADDHSFEREPARNSYKYWASKGASSSSEELWVKAAAELRTDQWGI